MKMADFLLLFRPDARVVISGIYAGEMSVGECHAWIVRHPQFSNLLTNQYSHPSKCEGIRVTSSTVEMEGALRGRIFLDISMPEAGA